jgi:hypothetical protein
MSKTAWIVVGVLGGLIVVGGATAGVVYLVQKTAPAQPPAQQPRVEVAPPVASSGTSRRARGSDPLDTIQKLADTALGIYHAIEGA